MEARDGQYAQMHSPGAPSPSDPSRNRRSGQRELLLQHSSLSTDLYVDAHGLERELVSDDGFDDTPPHQGLRRGGAAAAGMSGRGSVDGDALFLQSIEYAPRKSWAGGGIHGLQRVSSETVRLSSQENAVNVTPTRQSLATGITVAGTVGYHESGVPLHLVTGARDGSIPQPHLQPTYFQGSYRVNSYFAIRLLRIMQLIVVIDVIALVFFYVYRRGQDVKNGGALFVSSPFAAIFTRSDSCSITISLAALVYHLLPAVIILGLPASGIRMFEPFKREERVSLQGRIQKVKRTIFLQICETTAIIVFFVTAMVAAIAFYYAVVAELFSCTENPIVYVFGVLAVVVYVLVYVEIRYFMRFREHLKMQLGAFSEADQTGDVKAHYLRSKMRRRKAQEPTLSGNSGGKGSTTQTTSPSAPNTPPRRQIVAFVRKRLYRGAQLGDIRLLKRTLRIARSHLGMNFAKELYPDAQIRFGFFSKSMKNPMHVAAYSGSIAAMELLYRAHFSINSFDKISRVRFSTGDIFWNLARWFIRQPVVNAEDSYGASSILKSTLVTPLHCAVSTGRIDAVRWLLRRGADVNLCSRSSYRHESRLPPIFLADHPEIAKELLAAGANHLVIPDPGHMNTITVLQMAYLRGNYAVAQVLENWGGDVALTPLHTAAAMNNTSRIRHLLRKKVHPDCLGELGYVGLNKRTPLHWACVNGAIDAVELLLGAKADANVQDARGRTPLHWAARVNQAAAVKILLDHGADPNIVDDGGMTPILCASCAGGTTAEMFKLLVNHGANINHQLPSTGDTALHIAVKLDDLMTAMALLSVGGDIMRMNNDGLRPIDCTTSTRLQFEIKRAAGNRDVMISYTHSHKEFALKLRKSLEDANITTWLDLMDPSGIGGGAVWREEIARGVTNAAVVVCILTEDYAQSQWCMKELALAKQVGTPILALSTEHATIAEDLQVYLYTRQIIPFERAIVAVDRLGDKDIRYQYDDAAYKEQVRLLLDGLRDEIEKRREEVLRKNLTRAGSTMNTGGSNATTFNTSNTVGGRGPTPLGGSGIRARGTWNQATATTSGGVATYANGTINFDERTPAALLQEKMLLESTTREGFMLSSAHMGGLQFGSGRGRNNHTRPGSSKRWQGQQDPSFLDIEGSMLSANNDAPYADGHQGGMIDHSFGGLGTNDLSSSIILNQNGYYVHKSTDERAPASGAVHRGSVIESFARAKAIVEEGQQFVFISHGDWHNAFVRRLCAGLCREGGLHCYVDRRRGRLGRVGSKLEEQTESGHSASTKHSGDGDDDHEVDSSDEDMLARIHDAKEAILKCSAFVVILSEKTLSSQLVKDQLAFAEDKGKKIVPVVMNPLEFSLDMLYSLSRSSFYHFLTAGDMIGFEKSLDQVLTTLREEMFGISIDQEQQQLPSFARLPKTMSLGQLSSFSGHNGTEMSVRRRHGSGHSMSAFGGDTGSVVGSERGWIEPPSSARINHSFISTNSSAGGITGNQPPRALNSDMSLQQAMLGNFSTLMRRITDDIDDDDMDEGDEHMMPSDDIVGDDLDIDLDFDPVLMRSVSDTTDDGLPLSERGLMGSGRSSTYAFRALHHPRPGRLSSIMSTSTRSVSILERESGETGLSVDAVRQGP